MANVNLLLLLFSLALGFYKGNSHGFIERFYTDTVLTETTALTDLSPLGQLNLIGDHIFLGILLSAIIIYTAMYFMGKKRKEYLYFALMNGGLFLLLLLTSPFFQALCPRFSDIPLNQKLRISALNMSFIGFILFYSHYRGSPCLPRITKTMTLLLEANILFILVSPESMLSIQKIILMPEVFLCFSFVIVQVVHKIKRRAIHPLGFFPGLILILLTLYAPAFLPTSLGCGIFLKLALIVLIMQQIIYHTHLTLNSFNRIKELNRDYARLNLRLKDSLHRIQDQSALIHFMNSYDKMTGLANRSQLNAVLSKKMSEICQDKSELCLIMTEWEDYKKTLLRYGLEQQSNILQNLADRIKDFCGDEDWACRYSDDRFLLILPLQGESAESISDGLFRELRRPLSVYGNSREAKEEYIPRMSVGYTVFSDGSVSQETLLNQLFASIDHARRKGLCCPCGFGRNMDIFQMEKERLESRLEQALKKEQLEIFYQPQHDSWQYRITGMEALLRWNDPELGNMNPEDFISLAEETGLMKELDLYVLNAVLNQISRWRKTELSRIPVSLNVSPSNFADPAFIEELIDMTVSRNISPSQLELELTETILIYNHGQILSNIQRLKEVGFSVALDDFGTGYSSLAYLSDFPVDVLKIDKAFVNNLLTDKRKKGVVNSIIAIGQALGVKIVSEGVENEEELHYLRRAGCHAIQGYYFSPALPPKQMLEYIRKSLSA